MTNNERYSFKYDIGDYVTSDFDPDALYLVYGKYHDYYHTLNEEFYENFYDCYCVYSRKPYVLDEIDLTPYKRKKRVNINELREILGEYADDNMYTFINEVGEMVSDGKIEEAVIMASDNEKTSESVDDLLDELNDVRDLIALFGDHEDDDRKDGKYAKRKREIERKLKEMSINGKG